MTGPGDPPEGTPNGAPGGGEDEYRSVVFDESFVRAARLQEFSADERLGEHHSPAVRNRHAWMRLGGSRQAVLLVLLIVLAFGTAVYMGIRHPYKTPETVRAQPLRSAVVPLAPSGPVPGATPADLFAHSPAATYRIGAAGINLPAVVRTEHFSDGQIVSALTVAKDYLVRSSLDPGTLTGGSVRPVRLLLDTGQLDQFDRSLARPDDNGRDAATGWLVRFDPKQTRLADRSVRVNGTLAASELSPDALDVTADYTFVYAVRPAPGAPHTGPGQGVGKPTPGAASLVTVRREVHFRLSRENLNDHRLEVVQSSLQAGPLACSSRPADALRPLFAGQHAGQDRPTGTDPYARDRANPSLCGELASSAQPKPSHPLR
ncbi:SCO2583 family membrane protein [Streptomyces angustmyceticus]|uniref:SCO2583 family membrane protein n=1 Tax=Streptomyces angustmyceticus TaxID=285578 RepID=UPI0038021E3E